MLEKQQRMYLVNDHSLVDCSLSRGVRSLAINSTTLEARDSSSRKLIDHENGSHQTNNWQAAN